MKHTNPPPASQPASHTHSLEQRLLRLWFNPTAASPSDRLLAALLLKPLSGLYILIRSLSQQTNKCLRSKKTTHPPVLVIGNLIAGGTGKTPLVAAVCQHLTQQGIAVGIISRGYKRQHTNALYCPPNQPLEAHQAGDEPALLQQLTGCPMVISAQRAQAFELLTQHHPELQLILSDDGLQHHQLARMYEWVVFDERAAGNRQLLPAGPLREPLARLAHVERIVCTQGTHEQLAQNLHLPSDERWQTAPVHITHYRHLQTQTRLTPEQARQHFATHTRLAFSGLGNPKKFFDSLQHSLQLPFQTLALPDHFDYPPEFCAHLDAQLLLTTGKDAVKLDPNNPKIWIAEAAIKLPPALLNDLERYVGLTPH